MYCISIFRRETCAINSPNVKSINKMGKKSKTKITNMEVASVIIAIIAVGISIWSVYKSEDIAKKSGAFDKGELKLSIDNFNILETETYDVYFGINFKQNELNLLEFPISVTNIGNKTVEEIVLTSNYPSVMKVAIDNDLIKITSILGDDIKRKYFSSKLFDQVSLNLKSLNPSVTVNMNDLISAQETFINNQKVSAKTKDGKNINLSISASFDYKIITTLNAKDITSQNFQFNVQNINSINFQEVLKLAVKSKLSKKEKSFINRPFIIFIPEVENINGAENIKINQLKIVQNSGCLFKFDDEMKYLIQYNHDRTIKSIFDAKEITAGNIIEFVRIDEN